MFNRRSFLKYTGGTTLTLFTYGKFGVKEALAAIPGGTLAPGSVPKWQTPLLIPPAMPRAGLLFSNGQLVDYYEISVRQFRQQILPAGLPMTTVWGYGPKSALSPRAPMVYNAPSLTIEANHGVPVRVKWINELTDASGNYLPHLLPVDPTLHWANPPGGEMGRDMRPPLDPVAPPPKSYTGPVPMVTHVHGAVGVGDESDGYAEAWFLPAANNIPTGYATTGTWYEFFNQKAKSKKFTTGWSPGSATFQYLNRDRAGTKWYHDHTLGMTRLNVYAGPAGFYNVRGGPAGDRHVRDRRTNGFALLPGPAPSELTEFIPNVKYHEIPIAIQDRSFNDDGSLFYPDSREFFDGVTEHVPQTKVPPVWNPEFFGNMIMVNGNTWPFLEVERRRYRFRFLNGCQARFLILDFSGIPGVEVWQIGNEGGFLAAPVAVVTPANPAIPGSLPVNNRLLMSPAERADVIVDFSKVQAGPAGAGSPYTLFNIGPDEPFKGFNPEGTLADGTATNGIPGQIPPAASDSTGQVMQFRVVGRVGLDLSTPAKHLLLPRVDSLANEPIAVTRRLALVEEMDLVGGEEVPVEARLGTVDATDTWSGKLWMDGVTENPTAGTTEIWEFYNTTGDAHPMHVHETLFEVVNRQPILVDETTKTVKLDGETRPPEPWENGWKDTVIAYPGEVTRIKATFATPGQYAWHCHIVEHEDNEMMRPYRIGPEQTGQPLPKKDGGM